MTVKEVVQGTEPANDLEQFCIIHSRPLAFKRMMNIADGCKNPSVENAWVLISAVIAKMTKIVLDKFSELPLEAKLDVDILSDWLVKNIERVREEKIKEGLPVPARA
jgi:hypothetical protein